MARDGGGKQLSGGAWISPLHLFLCMPLAAAYMLTGLPSPEANMLQPIAIPAIFLCSALTAAGLLLLLIGLASRSKGSSFDRPLFLPCILFLVCGEAIYTFRALLPLDATIAIIIGAAFIGLGGALIFILWGSAFARLSNEDVAVNVSCSILLGGVLTIASKMVPMQQEATVVCVMAIIASCIPLEAILSMPPHDAGEPSGAFGFKAILHQRGALVQALLAFILCWVANACRWGSVVGDSSFAGLEGSPIALLAGVMAAAILFALLDKLKAHRAAMKCLNGISSIAVAVLMLSWFLSLMGVTALRPFISLTIGLSQGLAGCAVIAAAAEAARGGNRWSVFGYAGAAFLLSLLLFACISGAFPGASPFITPIIALVYLVAVNIGSADGALVGVEPGNAGGESPFVQDVLAPNADEAVMDAAAHAYGLSPRERELLPYLAHGYTAKYIADVECISLNTVKTHTMRIYGKLCIHTRDDLIACIDRFRS